MNYADMNNTFIIAAYSVMWLVTAGYMARLLVKGRMARAEYERAARESNGGTA